MHERHRSPCPSPLRSPFRSSKWPKEKRLRTTEWSWPRNGTELGWSDPTSLPREPWRSLQPTRMQRSTPRAKAVVMLLATQKSYELLAKYGFFAREICDKCGIVLGAVRFTGRDESGVWCSRECRGDGDRRTIRKGGRPRKYKTENERRHAERRQNAERQKAFRVRVQRNGKLYRSFAETKDLQAQKTHLSHYPLTPASSGHGNGFSRRREHKRLSDGDRSKTRVAV